MTPRWKHSFAEGSALPARRDPYRSSVKMLIYKLATAFPTSLER